MPGQHLYILQAKTIGSLKIGRSDNPKKRRHQLQTGCPYTLRLILVAPDKGHLEQGVHKEMHRHQTRWAGGEWFHESGMGDLPLDILEFMEPWFLEDPDWWKRE